MQIFKTTRDFLPIDVIATLDRNLAGIFCSLSWYDNFIENVTKVDKSDAWFIYSDSKQNNLIIMPVTFVVERSLRKIKSLSNYYSPIYSIFHGDYLPKDQCVLDFFSTIKSAIPEWDVIELRPLSLEDCLFLEENIRKTGLLTFKFYCFGNWYLKLNGQSFFEYYQTLSSQLKNTISRKSKKFFAMDGAKIEIYNCEKGLEKGLAAYGAVYASSWKLSEPYSGFMPGLIHSGIAQGIGRLGVAFIGEKPVAAQYWLVADRAAYIYKLAYDEAYKQYSVGTLLTANLMEYVIDRDKVEVVDYLVGDDAYKVDWMSDRRERFGLICFNMSSLRGIVAGSYELLKFYVKKSRTMINNIFIKKEL